MKANLLIQVLCWAKMLASTSVENHSAVLLSADFQKPTDSNAANDFLECFWQTHFEKYLKRLRVEKGLSEKTIVAYSEDIFSFIHFLSNQGIQPVAFRSASLEDYVAKLSREGLKPSSLQRKLSSIKGFLKYLVDESVTAREGETFLLSLSSSRAVPDYLTKEEMERLLLGKDELTPTKGSEYERKRDDLIVHLLYALGLRVSEVCSVKKENFSLVEGWVKILGKGNKERLVPMAPASVNLVKAYLALWKKENFFPPEKYLFPAKPGKSISPVLVWKLLKERAVAVGIKRRVHPHMLRHSFASHLIQDGASLRVVQELLGHASVQTTEIYTHLGSEKLRDEVKNSHPFAN
jgi:integrase/recombinase XerD